MPIIDWSSDVCSSDLSVGAQPFVFDKGWPAEISYAALQPHYAAAGRMLNVQDLPDNQLTERFKLMHESAEALGHGARFGKLPLAVTFDPRSEEHTSELQSLMRISYAVFCLKKKKKHT